MIRFSVNEYKYDSAIKTLYSDGYEFTCEKSDLVDYDMRKCFEYKFTLVGKSEMALLLKYGSVQEFIHFIYTR